MPDPRATSGRGAAALILLDGAYVAVYRVQFEAPAERLHLLEYGLLPPLVAWALGPARALGR